MNKKRQFTTNEINFLMNNYPKKSQVQIAALMRRSYESIRCKTFSLGLRTDKRRFWDKGEIDILLEYTKEGKRKKSIAIALNRSVASISSMLSRINKRRSDDSNQLKLYFTDPDRSL